MIAWMQANKGYAALIMFILFCAILLIMEFAFDHTISNGIKSVMPGAASPTAGAAIATSAVVKPGMGVAETSMTTS